MGVYPCLRFLWIERLTEHCSRCPIRLRHICFARIPNECIGCCPREGACVLNSELPSKLIGIPRTHPIITNLIGFNNPNWFVRYHRLRKPITLRLGQHLIRIHQRTRTRNHVSAGHRDIHIVVSKVGVKLAAPKVWKRVPSMHIVILAHLREPLRHLKDHPLLNLLRTHPPKVRRDLKSKVHLKDKYFTRTDRARQIDPPKRVIHFHPQFFTTSDPTGSN